MTRLAHQVVAPAVTARFKPVAKASRKRSRRDGRVDQRHSTGPTVGLVAIVRDEEEMLPRSLASIKGIVDEMVIVDTGSTDRTVEIAKEFGAKVVEFDWIDDFSAARNFGLDHCTSDWVLHPDADEEFVGTPKALKKSLKTSNKLALFVKILVGPDVDTALERRRRIRRIYTLSPNSVTSCLRIKSGSKRLTTTH